MEVFCGLWCVELCGVKFGGPFWINVVTHWLRGAACDEPEICLSPGILLSFGHTQVNVTALPFKNCLNLYIYGEFRLSRGADSPGSLRHSCSLIPYSWVKQLIGNIIRSFSSYLEGHLWKEAFLCPRISSLSLSVRENWAKNTNFFFTEN